MSIFKRRMRAVASAAVSVDRSNDDADVGFEDGKKARDKAIIKAELASGASELLLSRLHAIGEKLRCFPVAKKKRGRQ